MDLLTAIRQLYEERKRLDRVIASLEQLQKEASGASARAGSESAPRRRGRKAMSAEERQEVSRRMKQYWANRRNKG